MTLQSTNEPPIGEDQPSDAGIFITDKKELLKHRLELESHFSPYNAYHFNSTVGKISPNYLNIVTFDEAKEIIDHFLKFRNEYHIFSRLVTNQGGYYLLSFRSKIPYFHFNTGLDSFAHRFTFLLKSIDEIGSQYYSDVNMDTRNTIIYHFNYFIILMTGIFDSLATKTNDYYNLDHTSASISLNPKAGDKFLRALKKHSPDLRAHINKYCHFINLIYQFREKIVHQEMLTEGTFVYENKWNISFIKANKKIRNQIRQCKDTSIDYQVTTKWGLYTIANDHHIEPYGFTKTAARTLIEFSNEYLKLLGFNKFTPKQTPDEFSESIKTFDQFHLGF